MNRKITAIPATKSLNASTPLYERRKRRVAGYARVSTDNDDQFTSYEAQIDYYTNFIKERPDWEFVEVYTDEGITGTNTKHREGFKRMVRDALAGKIDLIVTRSVSRFARNTVDSLTTVRSLKEKNVEVYFEKENIWTLDSKGELLITIMSSLAQEEARSISENCTWGQRKRIADGKVSVPFGRFLGYDKGKDGNLVVNKEEAKLVKRIYKMFLGGMPIKRIATTLSNEGIISPGGKDKWNSGTIKRMLTNEKYKGDALLQKSFTVDFLTKKKKKNEGEVPQYYVENNHEPIIDPVVWDLVQELIAEVKPGGRSSKNYLLSGKLYCESCGGILGAKTWHSNSKYKRVVWQCQAKYQKKTYCQTPHLNENLIIEGFIKAINQLVKIKTDVTKDIDLAYDVLDTEMLEMAHQSSSQELELIQGMIEQLIEDNARKAQDQEQYNKKYNELVERFDKEKTRYEELSEKIADIKSRRAKLDFFVKELESLEPIQEFDNLIWNLMLDRVVLKEDGQMDFHFRNGTIISLRDEELSN